MQDQLVPDLEADKWSSRLNVVSVDEVCGRASCGEFERSDSRLTLDLSGNYFLSEQLRLHARMDDLTDEQDIVGRQASGARANKSRTVSVGAQYCFE